MYSKSTIARLGIEPRAAATLWQLCCHYTTWPAAVNEVKWRWGNLYRKGRLRTKYPQPCILYQDSPSWEIKSTKLGLSVTYLRPLARLSSKTTVTSSEDDLQMYVGSQAISWYCQAANPWFAVQDLPRDRISEQINITYIRVSKQWPRSGYISLNRPRLLRASATVPKFELTLL